MADGALGIALVDRFLLSTAKAPAHDVAHHCGTRAVEQFGEVINFIPRHCFKACVHADAVTRPVR
jgi:hypothetical protein